MPESPLPATTLMEPPRPLVDVPVAIVIQPLFPDVDDPVLNDKLPDTPREFELDVTKDTDPDPELPPALVVTAM
jgi:hypothetical protein